MQIPVFGFKLKLILAVCRARASVVGGWLVLNVSRGWPSDFSCIYILAEVI